MTKKNSRVHRETLPGDLAAALLNVPFNWTINGEPQPTVSVAARLGAARAALAEAVAAANEVLAENPLMEIIAEHAARLIGRRGTPIVVVDSNGEAMLEVHYLTAGEAVPLPVQPKQRKSKLPPISTLREEARMLGFDPEPYGKNKTKLIEAIDAAKAGVTPTTVKKAKTIADIEEQGVKPVAAVVPPAPVEPPKRTKTAPSVTPPKVVKLDGRKVIPLDDDDDDVASLFGPPDPPAPKPASEPEPPEPVLKRSPKVRPPRLGTPSEGAAKPARKGRSLSAIASGAETEVDIDAILAKPAPALPTDD